MEAITMQFESPKNRQNKAGIVERSRRQPSRKGIATTAARKRIGGPLAILAILLWALGVRGEPYTLPLLAPAGASGDPQGVLRILNSSAESGTVEIYAIDDAGIRTGPASFTLNASAAAQFTATDLQAGNTSLGLTGGIGADIGDARVEIVTGLDIVPLAFVRAADGTLSAMHDTVRGAATGESDGYIYEVPLFHPSTETIQVSRLRLINPGGTEAAVTISARDDAGAWARGGEVTLILAAGGVQRALRRRNPGLGDGNGAFHVRDHGGRAFRLGR